MIDRGSARIVFLMVVTGIVIFLIGPSLLMTGAAFSNGNALDFPPHGFSLRWYGAMFADHTLGQAFINTVYVSVVCTIVATVAGTAAAIILARYRLPFRGGIELLLLMPFTIPLAVEGVGLLNLSGSLGVLGARWMIGIAIAATNLPFVIGTVSAAAIRLDPYLEDAAASCGAYPFERLLTVTVPSLMPGIVVGALIMFVSASNEFVISSFLVDVRTMTLPVELFNQARGVTTPMIAAVSVLYTVVNIAIVWWIDRLVGLQLFLQASR